MIIDYITESFKGLRSEINKDSVFVLDKNEYILFLLFDGVGSAKNAKIGVDESIAFIKKEHESYLEKHNQPLKDLMYDTNQYLIHKNVKEPYTTYVALYISKTDNTLMMSSLGDSRLYGISKQYINQYSKDDKNNLSNRITKCLGIKNLYKNDFTEVTIKTPENRLLLCSDGFYYFLENNRSVFFEILNFNNLKNIKKRIKKEIEGNNIDDASYILINIYV